MRAHPKAVVMNMFYTGLGIARSLGEHGIPVIGLSAERGIYGNYTRYAKTLRCPDSRREPEALLAWLLQWGNESGARSVIFPTRDDDVLFLDRFRDELSEHFITTIPARTALQISLDKWATYLAAVAAGVSTPQCWLLDGDRDLTRVIDELTYPCVLKPVVSRDWRMGDNWQKVGARKAIGISSREELLAGYAAVARANPRALLQEMVPGGDECLTTASCYFDRASQLVAVFNTHKLIQSPEGFGTGCIVETADCPEILEPTVRLLRSIGFTGIAEVEYKWDAASRQYKLIEINPRPWDQHRLGKVCGTDLVFLAYCEAASISMPPVTHRAPAVKWIAEDTFITTALQLLRQEPRKVRALLAAARGKRICAIWSAKDPLPFVAYFATRFIPQLIRIGIRVVCSTIWSAIFRGSSKTESSKYEKDIEKGKSCA